MSRLGTESAFQILARAGAPRAQGCTIIHLQIGEPDFGTRAGLAALSGTAFGRSGEGYERLSCANSVWAIRGPRGAMAAVLPELEA